VCRRRLQRVDGPRRNDSIRFTNIGRAVDHIFLSNLSAGYVTKQWRARRNETETGNKAMDMSRFFGLDSFEWLVTLASSALIALAVWVM
jgi:hypothetical protein